MLQKLRAHSLDCVIGRTSAVLDMSRLRHQTLYAQQPRLVAHRRLAARLARRPLQWNELTELDWVRGPRSTPMRVQVTDFFLRAGVKPPPPFVESLSAKVIGELAGANERAVSIVPLDVAEELERMAGEAMIAHRFDWSLSPSTLFRREWDADYDEVNVLAAALRSVSASIATGSPGRAQRAPVSRSS